MTFTYHTKVRWTGNLGTGTSGYRDYSRDHQIEVAGKPVLAGSSDPAFRGDEARHTPEDMLVSALSACHMLWYLHLCADAGIVVTAYTDHAVGHMAVQIDGSGFFTEVVLRPVVALQDGGRAAEAQQLHQAAHRKCFIANSCNFPVRHEAQFVSADTVL